MSKTYKKILKKLDNYINSTLWMWNKAKRIITRLSKFIKEKKKKTSKHNIIYTQFQKFGIKMFCCINNNFFNVKNKKIDINVNN